MRRVAAEKRQQKESNLTDARKYMPGLDPLEKEAGIENIQPLGKTEADRMMKLINKVLSDGGLSKQEKKAFYFWKANLVVDNAQGIVHQEFMRDFWAWLLGRGKESDHKKSPWYRQSLCNDSEVAAYVDAFVTKRHDFQVKLQLLSMRHPVGINQHYLYFKYVVRGEKPSSSHFLDDWGLFSDEYVEARANGQKERNRDEIGEEYQGENAFHEMAPYGSRRQLVGQLSHDKKAEKMVQTAAKSWKDDDLSDEEGDQKDTSKKKEEIVDDKPTNSTNLLEEDSASEEDLPGLEEMGQIPEKMLSPEQKAETAKKFEEEANKKMAELQDKIDRQNKEILALQEAKQPAEKELALVKEMQESRALMERVSSQSVVMQQQFLAEIQANREARAKESADLKELLNSFKNVATPELEGSKPTVEDVTEANSPSAIAVLSNFHQKFDTFLNKFAELSIQSEARMREIENNLLNQSGSTGPLIEELDAMTGEFKSIAESLKDIPQKLLAIEAANQAEREAGKSFALALVADNNKNAQAIVAAVQESSKKDAEFLQSLLGNFDAKFNNMLSLIRANDVSGALAQQSALIGQIIEKVPAANAQLLLEFSNQIQAATENRIILHEQKRNIPNEQLTNALKTMENAANKQLEMVSQFQATAQRQIQLELTLKEAETAFKNLRSQKDQEIQFLGQRVDQAQRHSRFLESQARQSMQRSADLERSVNFLANQNRAQYQEFLRQRDQQNQVFNAWRIAALEYANQLAIENEGKGKEEATPMEIDDEDQNLSDSEKWLLGQGGTVPTLMIAGPNKKSPLPEFTDQEIAQLDSSTKKLFGNVRQMEKMLLEKSETFGKELGPEIMHVMGVKSLKRPVLENKFERYRLLLQQWGL